jgi:hypothetical protein
MVLFLWVGLVVHLVTAASDKPEDPHTEIIELCNVYRFTRIEKELAEKVFQKAGLSDHNWSGNPSPYAWGHEIYLLQVPAHKKDIYVLTINKSAKQIRDVIEACRKQVWSKRKRWMKPMSGGGYCGFGVEEEILSEVQMGMIDLQLEDAVDLLPEDEKAEMRKLIWTEPEVRERIRALFSDLQSRQHSYTAH